jgi:hypothetical protein
MEENETDWLPVVQCEGTEYAVNVQHRCFGQFLNSTEVVAFHSDEGRGAVRAMTGAEWRAWTLRERLDEREG